MIIIMNTQHIAWFCPILGDNYPKMVSYWLKYGLRCKFSGFACANKHWWLLRNKVWYLSESLRFMIPSSWHSILTSYKNQKNTLKFRRDTVRKCSSFSNFFNTKLLFNGASLWEFSPFNFPLKIIIKVFVH